MKILIETERPYFAEFAYYLWGEVNYDSDGDCKFSTDRWWTYLYVKNRVSKESFQMVGKDAIFEITSSSNEIEKKIAKCLIARYGAQLQGEDFETRNGILIKQ